MGRPLKTFPSEQRGRGKRWLVEYPRAGPLLIFFLVIAITVLSMFSIERSRRLEDMADLNRDAVAIGSAIERRAFANSSFLQAGAALFGTYNEVTPELFERFVSELRLESAYRGARAIGWAPVIDSSEVDAFERRLNQDRVAPLQVEPTLAEVPRDMLVPVLYLQPNTLRNRRALGYDMYSDPTRRLAMDTAAQEGRPTASGSVVLKQEGSDVEPGFLIYMPVFGNRDGTRELMGFIYSPINAAAVLASEVEGRMDEDLAVRLIEKATGKIMAQEGDWRETGLTVERDLDLANHDVTLATQHASDARLSPLSLLTLLFGVAVATLLTVVARLLTRQAEEDYRSLEWFAEQNSIRNSLTRELNHRVKNTLANVLSIVSMTRRRATSLDEFAEGIDSRIRALSATHDLLTQSDWGTTPVRSVVEVELAPYARGAEQQIRLVGPDVELAPNDALSLGLAMHELATNAAKYGALSVPGGSIDVVWTLVSEKRARIDWRESGGPPVSQPEKRGFGTDLIEKIVSHELRNPVELEFHPDGVRCSMLVPVRDNGEFELRSKQG